MIPKGYEPSYFTDTAKPVTERPSLTGSHSYDICIIGAGFTGLSSALHLAQQGYRVAVVEAERAGWGGSGRNGGQACPGHNMDHEELIGKVGRTAADALWDMAAESVELVRELAANHHIDCELKEGILYVASRESHSDYMKQAAEYAQEKLNYSDLEYVPEQGVQRLLGTDRFYAGKFWKRGLHLHPLNFALGLAAAAEKAGADIYEYSRVQNYRCGEQVEVNTAEGSITASYLILACNGYLENLAPEVAGKIMPINNFILATEPLSDELVSRINPQDIAVADSKFVVNYFKLSADNRMIWGGGETYTRRFPQDIRQFVKKNMLKIYPELANTGIDYGWGGTLAVTMNRMPHFARPQKNMFVAQGYSGHGVALATLAGKLMAEAVSTSAERFDVFAGIPTPTFPGGTYLRKPGLVAGMLYYALRDRIGL